MITNRYPTGPDDIASPFVYDFRKVLEDIDITVDIVTPFYQSQTEESRYLDGSVYRFEWSDGNRVISQLPIWNPNSYLKIRSYFKNGREISAGLLERNHYDAIMALWAAPSGYLAWRLSEKYNVPYAVWALGSDVNSWTKLPFIGRIIIEVLKNASALFADGRELAMKVQSLTDRSCQFIPSCHVIDLDVDIPGIKEKRFISVGRLEKNKGVFDLVKAFRIFSKEFPDWKLLFVGVGRAEKKLKKTIQSCGLDKRVKLCGYMQRRDINRLLVESAAAVIPSHSDSLPLTFGEAMQAKVPVICSDIGDMPYFIDAYKVGYHFPVGHVGELAHKMALIAGQKGDFSGNFSKVLEELNIANSAKAVTRWLDELSPIGKEKRFANAGA
jgi:glycosyltransferase involved in cell wall biosynthesis